MPELIILGTAASVPDADHDTVGMALRGPGWAVQVDCGGSPLYKLARAGVERESLKALVLNHRTTCTACRCWCRVYGSVVV
jgi:ribonuclease BN (tRNA processing enzyme)